MPEDSAMGKARYYLEEHCSYLIHVPMYCRLELSNNSAEHSMGRMFPDGRSIFGIRLTGVNQNHLVVSIPRHIKVKNGA